MSDAKLSGHLTRVARRTLALAAVAGLAIALAASAASDPVDVRAMVLTTRDTPVGFAEEAAQSYNIRQDAAQGTWTLAQLRSWGYIAGYETQFDRALASSDPQQISSNAGAYRGPPGAQRSLDASGLECLQPRWTQLSMPHPVGNAAWFCVQKGGIRGYNGESFFVVWREGRFKGSITLTGRTKQVTAGLAMSLATVQAKRMEELVRAGNGA